MTAQLDLADWARRLRVAALGASARPTLDHVLAVRQLLAQQPSHYLGGQWQDLCAELRTWLERAESRLPSFHRLPPDDPPAAPTPPRAWDYTDI
jgi:hypothetical protein